MFSPGAMKLVSGFPVALAAEHLAIVGELRNHRLASDITIGDTRKDKIPS